MSYTQTLGKNAPTSFSHKTNIKPNSKTPTAAVISAVSSPTLLFSLASLSLLSFSLLFLSFSDTTFWFFLSNSIILFIAAVDSDAFSGRSKPRPDLYDDYVKTIRSRNAFFHSSYPSAAAAEPLGSPSDPSACGSRHDDVKDIVVYSPETVTGAEEKEPAETNTVTEKRAVARRCSSPVIEKPVRGSYGRSKSSKAIVVVGGRKKKAALRRSETEIGSQKSEEAGDLPDFSAMSDEELYRRVEEFIRRNREIRLQEMRDQTENS